MKNSRITLYELEEKTFRVPLKYIDVTRQTNIDIDNASESAINDIWTEDKIVNLSEAPDPPYATS